MRRLAFLLLMNLLLAADVIAVEQIEVQALFGGKAMIRIDGVSRTLSSGETSPEGVRLIEADSKQAMLEVGGVSHVYRPGSSISLDYQIADNIVERVYAGDDGMFHGIGSINGRSVEFLLDTGATTVAMNKQQAKSLGVHYRMHGEPAMINTASEQVRGYTVKLKSVSLGGIRQRNVEAMVIDGEHPGPILLGMSFLDKLAVEKNGRTMTLRQRK
jgi:aspartyl protease family protein